MIRYIYLIALLIAFYYKINALPYGEGLITLKILHTNDLHAHFEEFNNKYGECTELEKQTNQCYGGYARLIYMINKLRKEYSDHTLLFDAGDSITGTLMDKFYKSEKSIEIINHLSYDAITIGNHELDMGPKELGKFYSKITIPIVSSNLNLLNYPQLNDNVKKVHIIKKFGIGIIGALTTDTPFMCRNTEKVEFLNVLQSLQYQINQLKFKGIHKIIVLSHNGYEDDLKLAKQLIGVSLIIGGHSHTLLSNNLNNTDVKDNYPKQIINDQGERIYIVQAGFFGKYLGNLDITWDQNGKVIFAQGEPILLDQKIPKSYYIENIINQWKLPYLQLAKKVMGIALEKFNYPCNKFNQECEIGNLITKALLWKSKGQADISLMNGNGIRAGLDAGKITYEHLYELLPNDNDVVLIKLKGQEIKNLIENGFIGKNLQLNKPIISKLLLAGITFNLNLTKGDNEKSSKIRINEKPLNLNKIYNVITTGFIADGGDYFLNQAKPSILIDKSIIDTMISYIKVHKVISPNKGYITYV